MSEETTFRKVQLDSIEDLRYIYENMVKSAREKINVHVPPTAGGSDLSPQAQQKEVKKTGKRRSTRNSAGSATGGMVGVDGDGGGGGGEGDPLRKKVEELVMEYIIQTFDFAVPSISINGIDTTSNTTTTNSDPNSSSPPSASTSTILNILKSTTDEFEPYDRALGTRLQTLYADIENTTLKVSRLRRANPERATKRYEKALNSELEKDLKLIEKITQEGEEERKARGLQEVTIPSSSNRKAEDGDVVMQDSTETQVGAEAGEGTEKKVVLPERYQEMVRDWERSMGVMSELTKGLPATTSKLERAEAALDYIQGKEKRRRVAE